MLHRSIVIACVTCLLGFPDVAAASAAPDATPDATTDVSALASEAAQVLIEEQSLLGAIADQPGERSTELDVQLRSVDGDGVRLLAALQSQGVQLSEATVTALGRLPRAGEGFAPVGSVYDAAIADLGRIAATPGAMIPDDADNSGPALGLLAVAAMSLLVLGAAALGNTLRRRENDDELAAMAWSDGLTGLANRRRLDHDLAGFDSALAPVASIMVDVDHFKSVNDTFGHQEGDEMLRRVADMLSGHVRYDDVVYRYGGEEFCVLLPGATRDDAVGIGQRIVEAARRIRLPDGSHLTVSVGIAHSAGATASESCHLADRALLAAKECGRDQLVDAATLHIELETA